MVWLSLLQGLLILIALGVLVQLARLLFADSDLTVQWAEYFGQPTSRLRGKVVWITGASSGIGEYLAYELAAVGCKLVLSARRKEELERVKKQCLVSGPITEKDILVLSMDVVKFDCHRDHVTTVMEHFRQIDVLVNNAGRSQTARWKDISLLVDREMLEVNVLGVISLTRAVIPHMVAKNGGHIVVVSSLAGKIGKPLACSYSGSKHALHGWFETLRIEGHEKNLKVTIICPGYVFSSIRETGMTGKPGEVYGHGMMPDERRMSTARCATLMAVSIANEIDEAWISMHPALGYMYFAQYMPSLTRKFATHFMMNFRKPIPGER